MRSHSGIGWLPGNQIHIGQALYSPRYASEKFQSLRCTVLLPVPLIFQIVSKKFSLVPCGILWQRQPVHIFYFFLLQNLSSIVLLALSSSNFTLFFPPPLPSFWFQSITIPFLLAVVIIQTNSPPAPHSPPVPHSLHVSLIYLTPYWSSSLRFIPLSFLPSSNNLILFLRVRPPRQVAMWFLHLWCLADDRKGYPRRVLNLVVVDLTLQPHSLKLIHFQLSIPLVHSVSWVLLTST